MAQRGDRSASATGRVGTPLPAAREIGHIPGLDGLRALACLAVFGVHWQQLTGFAASAGPFDARRLLENGNTGVSLFFTLSAFLLSLRFWSGEAGVAGRAWVGDYLRSRAVRILPAYYACLIGIALSDERYWRSSKDLLLHVGFLHNWQERTFYSFNPSFWTVAVQVQSYLLIPLVIVVALRASGSWHGRAVFLSAAMAASYLLHWTLLTPSSEAPWAGWVAAHPTVATHSLLAHAPHFFLGLLAGLAFVRRSEARDAANAGSLAGRDGAVALVALGVLLVLATPLDGMFDLPYGRYNLPLVPAAVAWLIVAVPRAPRARAVLETTPLRLLGVISYGVFVYHYPSLRIARWAMAGAGLSIKDHPWPFGALGLLLAVAIAAASYRYLETPLARRLRRRA